MTSTIPPLGTILRCKQVLAKLNVSRATFYNWQNPKSPGYIPSFPKALKIGLRASGWIETELDQWLASRRNPTEY